MRLAWLTSLLAGIAVLSASHPAIAQNSFAETDLVSDIPGRAALTDPNLVNPWGLVPGGQGVFWASDNGTGVSTLYRPDGTRVNLVVTIPGGENTGVVVTDPADSAFVIPSADTTARAIFIFVSEAGTISAWNNTVNPTNAIQVASTPDAIFKGLALARTPAGPRLYAANFHAGTIDVFNRFFKPVGSAGAFVDSHLPDGYGPFNIANIGGQLFVSYAKQDENKEDDVAGPGFGFIDVFDLRGRLLRRFASNGHLNGPWGMVLAPPGFGAFGGHLLVGNFGDGTINAFSLASGAFLGALRDTLGSTIAIHGLWGLHFGRPVSGPAVAGRLYFAAGIEGEQHGLFGYLAPRNREIACDDRARDLDFWRGQCHGSDRGDFDVEGHGSGRGVPSDSLRALLVCVSSFSRPFGPLGCFTADCDLLSKHGRLNAGDRAAQQFLALQLDRCAGLICDSEVVNCGGAAGDRDGDDDGDDDGDHDGKRPGRHGHHPRGGSSLTVGEIVVMIDTTLCGGDRNDRVFAKLAQLAACAISSGESHHGRRKDDHDGLSIAKDASPANLEIMPLGGNPVRLANGLGARFLVSTKAAATVRLGVYDAAGRLVAEPLRNVTVAGPLVVRWDGLNLRGVPVPSGTYFYRAVSDNAVAGGRIVVLH